MPDMDDGDLWTLGAMGVLAAAATAVSRGAKRAPKPQQQAASSANRTPAKAKAKAKKTPSNKARTAHAQFMSERLTYYRGKGYSPPDAMRRAAADWKSKTKG